MWRERRKSWQIPSCRVKLRGKRSRGRPARYWLDDVKEWTELSPNEMWREPDDRVSWRKHVPTMDWKVYGNQDYMTTILHVHNSMKWRLNIQYYTYVTWTCSMTLETVSECTVRGSVVSPSWSTVVRSCPLHTVRSCSISPCKTQNLTKIHRKGQI